MSLRSLRWLVLLPLLAGLRPVPDRTAARYGMWYWHTPFRIEPDERKTLHGIGIRDLYVRAGTLTFNGSHAKTMLPQRWETVPDGFRVVLTLNFDPGLVSHLETIPVASLADDVAQNLQDARIRARANGIDPKGFQLDVDCPTRLLPRYATLLRRVRAKLDVPLSITALPTWLSSSQFEDLADAVDEVVPQFYEGQTGRTLETVAPVADPIGLAKGLRQLAYLDHRFKVGLATYGHALIYGPDGRLSSIYHGLSPEDALRHPSLRFREEKPLASGERLTTVQAIAADVNGRGKGATIAYVLPTAESLRRQLDVFERQRPGNCGGAILYRFPEKDEAMALPLRTVATTKARRTTAFHAEIKLSKRVLPWTAIAPKSNARRLPTAMVVRAAATGDESTAARPRAFMLLLRLDRPGVQSVGAGDFDEAVPGRLDAKGRFARCAPAHADVVLLSRNHFLPDQTLASGIIETIPNGATEAFTEWAAKTPGGETRGRSSNLLLSAPK
ncbi:DUF3142 domain-containing protein [bacterium]|nr:MAG: DUF3142 domain-containing protein [bacterium]